MRFPLPEPQPPISARWTSAGFADELRTWATEQLGAPVVLENLTQRPWATVWKVHAPDGLFYAKQNCPLQNYEAALVQALAGWQPEHVIVPRAVDLDRGLLLSPYGGPVLGDHDPGDIDLWCRVVAQWAEVQRAVADRIAGFQELTVFRTEDAPVFVAERIEALNGLGLDDRRRLSDESAGRLEALLPTVASWADQVAALGLPLTLNHNDLHAWNVVAGQGDELRFFDLGDAVVAEPLSAFLGPLASATEHLPDGGKDGVRRRLRDAFLEVWSDRAPVRELRAALPAAFMLARLMRHESWVRVCASMSAAELDEFGNAPALWLETLLSEPWNGLVE